MSAFWMPNKFKQEYYVVIEKNTKAQQNLPLFLALEILAGIWIGATFAETPNGQENDLKSALYKLQEIITYINQDYVR